MNSQTIRLLQFPVEHNQRMTRARTFPDIMRELENLYAKDHSFTIDVNGEISAFKDVYQWQDEAGAEIKDLYVNADFLTVNTLYNDDTHKVEYDVYMMVDGKIASLAHVQADVVEEEGQLKYRHAAIKLLI